MDETLKQEIIELIKENRAQDSIEIGHSKTGNIKVYVDFSNRAEAELKIKEAIAILKVNRGEILDY